MTAAAPAPDLTNPSTAAVRLLAALRWFVLLLLIHWLIAGGRKLSVALRQGTAHPDFPLFTRRFGTADPAVIRARITRGLRRAIDLEAELLSTGPTDQRLADIAHRRAIAAISPQRRRNQRGCTLERVGACLRAPIREYTRVFFVVRTSLTRAARLNRFSAPSRLCVESYATPTPRSCETPPGYRAAPA